MNKKILIGSIIAVAVLIGVSFTSVVGYQSVKSNVKASPLFTVRTKRAIDEEIKDLTCDYVGKSKDVLFQFPQRDNKTTLIEKFIKSINQMSDETIEKLIAFLINYAQRDKRLNNENPDRIKEALYRLRDNSKSIPIFDVNINAKNAVTVPLTCGCTKWHYFIGCICLLVLITIINLIHKRLTWACDF